VAPTPWGFYKRLSTGGTVSRRTANKKLTTNYTDHHESLTKTTNCTFIAKKWSGTTKINFSGDMRRTS